MIVHADSTPQPKEEERYQPMCWYSDASTTNDRIRNK